MPRDQSVPSPICAGFSCGTIFSAGTRHFPGVSRKIPTISLFTAAPLVFRMGRLQGGNARCMLLKKTTSNSQEAFREGEDGERV